METKTIYNAALYCRLSRDDNNGNMESNSIQSQRDMLTGYAKEHGYNVYDCYVDDGYTGTMFDNRPNFQRMLDDIRLGRINMVLTKDLSRLGRNYIMIGQYRDFFFPEHGVRYIAINDGYDGLNEDNDIAAFKDILNEMYSKDISKKMRSARKVAAAQGKFMGRRPPYGYKRSETNKHALVIDERVSGVVKRIFALYAGGESARHIGCILTSEGILPPNEFYFRSLGQSNPYRSKLPVWGSASIMGLLKQQVYIGHTVQGKVFQASHKLKKRIVADPKDWIIVENTHEPLIDTDLWNSVQARIKSQKEQKKRSIIKVSSLKEVSMFSGLVKCQDCGGLMAYNVKTTGNNKYYVYRCSTYANNGRGACSVHMIHQSALETVLLNDILHYAKLADSEESALIDRLMKANAATRLNSVKDCKKRLNDVKKRISDIDGLIKRLFEEKAAGNLPDTVFKKLVADYDTEQQGLNENLVTLNNELADCETKAGDITAWVSKIKECISLNTLDRPTLIELVEGITVSETYKVDGEKRQDVTIKYKFVGVLNNDN